MTRNDSGIVRYSNRIGKLGGILVGASHFLPDSIAAVLKPAIFLGALCVCAALTCPESAQANPEGGQVIAGSASIMQSTPTRLDVHQTTDKAILDWRGFNIDPDEHTNFQQPSNNAVILNRVSGVSPSNIQGRMTANGHVFLVNPSGVVFGKGAQVDVGGLVATTADIGNKDFMEGRYVFDQASSNPNASVINRGQITVGEGGVAVLAAPAVRNEGLIQARLGRVALAGTKTFTLDFHGDGLLQFGVGAEVTEQPKDTHGQPLDSLVANAGRIVADGGQVALTANGKDAVVDHVINMEGMVQAQAVDVEGGTIILSGGETGVVAVSGTLDVSGEGHGQTGGTVNVLGDKVGLLSGAKVAASGGSGGGEVLIGGNFQGKGPERNARRTYVAPDAVIEADAKGVGNGGRVIVWADEIAAHHGSISAQGGALDGDGGFVEVSGKRFLDFKGSVLVDAPEGQAGTLLLDPRDIVITRGTGAQDGQIHLISDAGTQVTAEGVLFSDPEAAEFSLDFTLGAESLEALEGNIVLQAERDIKVDAPLNLENQTVGEFVVLQAGQDIIINADIRTNGADLHLEADSPHAPIMVDVPRDLIYKTPETPETPETPGGLYAGQDIIINADIPTNGAELHVVADPINTLIIFPFRPPTLEVGPNVQISTGIRETIDEADIVPGEVLNVKTGGDITLIARNYEIDPNAVIDAGKNRSQIMMLDPSDPAAGLIELTGGDITVGYTGDASETFQIGGTGVLSPDELLTFRNARELWIGRTATAGDDGLPLTGADDTPLSIGVIEVAEPVSIPEKNNIQELGLDAESIGVLASLEFDPLVSDPVNPLDAVEVFAGLTLFGNSVTVGPGARVTSNFSVNLDMSSLDIQGGASIATPYVHIDALNPINLSTAGEEGSLNLTPTTLQRIDANTLMLESDAIVVDNITRADLGTIAFLGLFGDTVTFTGGPSEFGNLIVDTSRLEVNSVVTGETLASLSTSNLDRLGSGFTTLQLLADVERPQIIGDSVFDSPVTIYAGFLDLLQIEGTLVGNEGASITITGGGLPLNLFPDYIQEAALELLKIFPATPILSGDIITAGAPINIEVPVVLGANVDLVTTADGAAGADITVAAVDADAAANNRTLTMLAGIGTVSAGDVGTIQSLGALSANGAFVNLNDVITTGPQDYTGATRFNSDYVTNGGPFTVTGPLFLESDTTVTTDGGAILFDGTVDGNNTLVLSAATGDISINGAVGSTQALDALSADGALISVNDVTTTGPQDYTGAIRFNSDYVTDGGVFTVTGTLLLASDTTVTTNGGAILFDGTVDGNNALILSAGIGDIVFAGDVGTLDPLGPVTILSAQDIAINGRFIASDTSISYTGFLTTAPDSLAVPSLFLDPTASGARIFGSVGGVPGFATALFVDGPVGDPDFLINGCVIGVPCVLGLPPAAEPRSRPPISVSKPGGPATFEMAPIFVARQGSEIPPDDPTASQFSNFGNEELWMR